MRHCWARLRHSEGCHAQQIGSWPTSSIMSISPLAAHPPYRSSVGSIQIAGHNPRPRGNCARTSSRPYVQSPLFTVRIRADVKLCWLTVSRWARITRWLFSTVAFSERYHCSSLFPPAANPPGCNHHQSGTTISLYQFQDPQTHLKRPVASLVPVETTGKKEPEVIRQTSGGVYK